MKTAGVAKKPSNYYQNLRPEVFEHIPKHVKTVLEIGCGEGKFGECIKAELGAEVWGIEPVKKYAKSASKVLDKVFDQSVEDAIRNLPKHYFDLVVANDVLEHLVDPYEVVKNLTNVLTKKGIIVSSIPNMRNFHVMRDLTLYKNWEYQETGILDKTHMRFFTTKTIKKLFEENGYDVEKHIGINKEKNLPLWYRAFNFCSMKKFEDMQYVQYLTIAKVKK